MNLGSEIEELIEYLKEEENLSDKKKKKKKLRISFAFVVMIT